MTKSFFLLVFFGTLFLPGCLFQKISVVSPDEIPANVNQTEPQQEKMVTPVGADIFIESPKDGEKLSSPFVVKGRARVFENVLNVDVKGEDGGVVISEIVPVHAKDVGEFGDFSISLHFQFTNTRKGTIEVYSLSPKDGSKENFVFIPVEFEVLAPPFAKGGA